MWTAESRPKYERKGLRYPSDLTDEEWALIEPLFPPGRKPPPHKPPVDRRRVLNALHYVVTTGCHWRQLPKDFPPKSAVHDYFVDWRGLVLVRVHNALYAEARRLAERQPEPTLVIVDSQSVKRVEKGGACIDAPGYDGAMKIEGKKQHAAVDTQGLLIGLLVTPGNIQDRDAISPILRVARGRFRSLKAALADGGYQYAATARCERK